MENEPIPSSSWDVKSSAVDFFGSFDEQFKHEPASQKDFVDLGGGDVFITKKLGIKVGTIENVRNPTRHFRHKGDSVLQVPGANTIGILARNKIESPMARKPFEEKSRLLRARGIAEDSEASS